MDGRILEPIIHYLKTNFDIDYVDMITESGPEKIIAEDSEKYKINSIKQRLDISINKHGSKIILMAGHAGCTTNPVEKETHIAQVLQSSAALKNWFPQVQIIPVWIGDDWVVEPI
jgi:hypothetical protein